MRNKIAFLIGLLSFGLLVALYLPGLHGTFFFDDGPSILLPPGIKLDSLSAQALQDALWSGGAGPFGRPVAQLSFALNYYFSDFDPFAFKLTNLCIHFTNGCLIFWLTLGILKHFSRAIYAPNLLLFSGAVALFWLIHPIQVLPVLHVVQRMTSLSTFFLLAALLFHIHGRTSGNIKGVIFLVLGWCLCWPLSVFSKETGLLFPLFALTWEIIIFKSPTGRLDKFAQRFTILLGIVFTLVTFYAFSPSMQWLWKGYDIRSFTLMERLLTETRVLWYYLTLILFPRFEQFGLYHDDIPISMGLISPWTTLLSIVGWFGFVSLALWIRKREPVVSFGLLWFLVGHLMESSILPLEIAHEHRNYIPSLGIILAVAWPIFCFMEHPGTRRTIGFTACMALGIYLPLITGLRSSLYKDEGKRTQIEAQHHRKSARAQFDAGNFLLGLPEASSQNSPIYAFSRKHFEISTSIDPDFKMGLIGKILLNCKANISPDTADIQTLAARLQKTPFAPADRNILFMLKEATSNSATCLSRNNMDLLFASAIKNATASDSVRAILYSWYADYLVLQIKDFSAGKKALSLSLKLEPFKVSNQLKWVQLILLEDNIQEASRLLARINKNALNSSEKEIADQIEACIKDPNQKCKPL